MPEFQAARTLWMALCSVKGGSGGRVIKASSEYQNASHPIHQQSAEHKRLLEKHIAGLAEKAGLADPGALARQLLLLKEGAFEGEGEGSLPLE